VVSPLGVELHGVLTDSSPFCPLQCALESVKPSPHYRSLVEGKTSLLPCRIYVVTGVPPQSTILVGSVVVVAPISEPRTTLHLHNTIPALRPSVFVFPPPEGNNSRVVVATLAEYLVLFTLGVRQVFGQLHEAACSASKSSFSSSYPPWMRWLQQLLASLLSIVEAVASDWLLPQGVADHMGRLTSLKADALMVAQMLARPWIADVGVDHPLSLLHGSLFDSWSAAAVSSLDPAAYVALYGPDMARKWVIWIFDVVVSRPHYTDLTHYNVLSASSPSDAPGHVPASAQVLLHKPLAPYRTSTPPVVDVPTLLTTAVGTPTLTHEVLGYMHRVVLSGSPLSVSDAALFATIVLQESHSRRVCPVCHQTWAPSSSHQYCPGADVVSSWAKMGRATCLDSSKEDNKLAFPQKCVVCKATHNKMTCASCRQNHNHPSGYGQGAHQGRGRGRGEQSNYFYYGEPYGPGGPQTYGGHFENFSSQNTGGAHVTSYGRGRGRGTSPSGGGHGNGQVVSWTPPVQQQPPSQG
jgi:hypothetical protein